MRKPIIGILSRVQLDREKSIIGVEEKAYIETDYIKAITLSGGVPIILPVVLDYDLISTQIKVIDGLLVPGGTDLDSLIYGEEPIKNQGIIFDDIDNFDINAIRIANNLHKPILGICKGLQALNVAFGGTLYQDLSQIEDCYIKHSQQARKHFASHTIKIKKGTKLYEILGENVKTNSYHHQAVKKVAPGFIATSSSLDGVIESIESTNSSFILGVQWHPEMMVDVHSNMLDIFKKFIQESINNSK